MKQRAEIVPVAIFAVLLALFALPLLRGADPAAVPSALIGKSAPKFSLPAALPGGKGFRDADLRAAGPSLVNVFSSWCETCSAEHAVLADFARREKLPLYGIDYKDTPEALERWLKPRGNPYKAVGADADGRVAIDWGVYGVPETYVVDRRGVVRYRYAGALTQEDCETILKPLLAELRR
jgi:cytochrome c biogenesis protein CcmG/thiol:disulfide interchange protein DsbE